VADIQKPDPEVHTNAVTSVTETVPHPADADSSPGPYAGLEVNRPPVSTNDPTVPIAHSLVAGAGAPSPAAPEPTSEPPSTPTPRAPKSDA
jgi:hypothetical protein